MIRAIIRFLTPKQTARADFIEAQVEYFVAVGRQDTRRKSVAGKKLVAARKRCLLVGA